MIERQKTQDKNLNKNSCFIDRKFNNSINVIKQSQITYYV